MLVLSYFYQVNYVIDAGIVRKLEIEGTRSFNVLDSLLDYQLSGDRYFESLELLSESSIDFCFLSPRRLLLSDLNSCCPESDLLGVFMKEFSIES